MHVAVCGGMYMLGVVCRGMYVFVVVCVCVCVCACPNMHVTVFWRGCVGVWLFVEGCTCMRLCVEGVYMHAIMCGGGVHACNCVWRGVHTCN